MTERTRIFRAFLALAACITVLGVAPVRAQDEEPPVTADTEDVIRAKLENMIEGERRKLQRGIDAKKMKKKDRKAALQVRPVVIQEAGEPMQVEGLKAPGLPQLDAAGQPLNVKLNNPVGDGPNAGQSELSIAMWGQYGVAGWNDGQGFINPASGGQGIAYTTDGGVTWTDVGQPPVVAPVTAWTSDPVVGLNEKTGEFYFCALVNATSSRNGIAVARATFVGGAFQWDPVLKIVRLESNSTHFLDKEWMIADSTNGNLYVTYTDFYVGGNDIMCQTSTDNGATWGPALQMNADAGSGRVQGSRPVVAGDGTLYVTWRQIGFGIQDFVMIRRSTDAGVSFDPPLTAHAYFDNFGTGAPGFNRNRNVVEPCPAVDRSFGPNRGRVAITVHESLNWFNDPLGGGGARVEIENNNFFNRATPFTPGHRLRGNLASSTDLDYFAFDAVQGTSYIFWSDSIPRPLYTMRVFCGVDTLTRLALSGDQNAPAGAQGFILWTAPATGTYYLRMAFVAGGAANGGYRIQTGIANRETEPGRDMRDVIVRTSDDGGTTWSPPTLANDDAPLYDNFLPEVGFTTEGTLYSAWYDWRDSPGTCAGSSHIYVSRSLDGGGTWDPAGRVTTAISDWTIVPTNIAPNQGDYIGLYGGDVLALAWGDGRRPGTVDLDAFGAILHTTFAAACNTHDALVTSGNDLSATFTVSNANELFANAFDYAVTTDRGWTGLPAGSVNVDAQGSTPLALTITVPDTAAGGLVVVTLTVTLPNGALSQSCSFTFEVNAPPVCSAASASPEVLWPASHQYVPVSVAGVFDPDGDPVTLVVDQITQDEPLNTRGDGNSCPDAQIAGSGALLRAERSGTAGLPGNGRVYAITFTATDGRGGSCTGVVNVIVPHDIANPVATDDGQGVVATGPCVGAKRMSESVTELSLDVTRVTSSVASFQLSLPTDTDAHLAIFDVAGRRMVTIASGPLAAGVHQRDWDLSGVPRGVYYARLRAGEKNLSRVVHKAR